MEKQRVMRWQLNTHGSLLLFLILAVGLSLVEIEQAGVAAASAPETCKNCLYLPMIRQPGPGVDLVIKNIEVTQAIQDENNQVPLVAGRPTVVRVFALAQGYSQPVENVEVAITISSDDPNLSSRTHNLLNTVPVQLNRQDYGGSINFTLPEAWLEGDLRLTVQLDPRNLVLEDDEDNNQLEQLIVFQPVPDLRIRIVPVEYTHQPTGRTYAAPTTNSISDWVERTYPVRNVEVNWHVPYAFQGDLKTAADFNRLLTEVTTLKLVEGAPEDEIFYALVPPRDSTTGWFSGGIAGIAWVGLRVAVGLDLAGSASQIAAHEIGHNLGLGHSPCGVSGDPNYPYPYGSIGRFGLDLKAGKVYSPTSSKDIMSYCTPRWISDYTYLALMKAQMQLQPKPRVESQSATPAVVGDALLVRAQIDDRGARLLPAYVLPNTAGSSQPSEGPYQVQVLDANGQVIASAAARSYSAGDGDPMEGIQLLLPLPEQPAAGLRLLKDGQVLAELALGAVTGGQGRNVTLMNGGQMAAWSAPQAQERPGLLRYSVDGGQSWSVLAVDAQAGQVRLPAGLAGGKAPLFEVLLAETAGTAQ